RVARGDQVAPESGDPRRGWCAHRSSSRGRAHRNIGEAPPRSQRSGLRSKESGLHGGRDARDTAVVRTYGQYCPIARGAEIFAERWTPLIVRNLHLGCETFGEILA